MRSRRSFTAPAAAVVIGSAGLTQALTGVAAGAPEGAVVTVVKCAQVLKVDPDSGLDGLATLWFGDGRVAFFGQRISGGTIRFGGEVTVRSGDRTAWLTDLTVDIGTGTVDATLDRHPVRLAAVDTGTLRLHKNPGEKFLFVDLGSGDDKRIVLTSDGASALDAALGTDLLEAGWPLLAGTISAGIPVDEEVAAEVVTDRQALIDNGVDVRVALDERIDLSDDLVAS